MRQTPAAAGYGNDYQWLHAALTACVDRLCGMQAQAAVTVRQPG